jgi:hypothetical protein
MRFKSRGCSYGGLTVAITPDLDLVQTLEGGYFGRFGKGRVVEYTAG